MSFSSMKKVLGAALVLGVAGSQSMARQAQVLDLSVSTLRPSVEQATGALQSGEKISARGFTKVQPGAKPGIEQVQAAAALTAAKLIVNIAQAPQVKSAGADVAALTQYIVDQGLTAHGVSELNQALKSSSVTTLDAAVAQVRATNPAAFVNAGEEAQLAAFNQVASQEALEKLSGSANIALAAAAYETLTGTITEACLVEVAGREDAKVGNCFAFGQKAAADLVNNGAYVFAVGGEQAVAFAAAFNSRETSRELGEQIRGLVSKFHAAQSMVEKGNAPEKIEACMLGKAA